jgi:hypothetical protein
MTGNSPPHTSGEKGKEEKENEEEKRMEIYLFFLLE